MFYQDTQNFSFSCTDRSRQCLLKLLNLKERAFVRSPSHSSYRLATLKVVRLRSINCRKEDRLDRGSTPLTSKDI